MREVKFRWIDQYLIHLTIKEKFQILFWLPLVAITVFALINLSNSQAQKVAELQAKVDTAANLLAGIELDNKIQKALARQGLTLQDQHTVNASQEHWSYSAAISGSGKVIQVESDLSPFSFWQMESTELIGFTVMLSLLVLTSYYITTFFSGALFSTNKAIQTLANGDLAESKHKIVSLVKDSSDSLDMAAGEFKEHAISGESLAQNQRLHLDSLATAMEQMTAAIH